MNVFYNFMVHKFSLIDLKASVLNIRDGHSLITNLETDSNQLLKSKLLSVLVKKHEVWTVNI